MWAHALATRRVAWLGIGLFLFFLLLPAASAGQPVSTILGVPYPSQIPANDPNLPVNWPFFASGNPAMPNGFCTCACIEMRVDCGEALNHGNQVWPQSEIAAVANTNDVHGRSLRCTGGWRFDVRAVATAIQRGNAPLRVTLHVLPRAYGPGTAAIGFGLPVAGPTDRALFDVRGRWIATLSRGRAPSGTTWVA